LGAVTVYAWFAGAAGWSTGFLPLAYGAVADYHRSGVGSFSGFLLQDIYGAMVAHQMLSVVIGLAAGLADGAVACGVRALTRSVAQPAR
jgi:hypothetical protein